MSRGVCRRVQAARSRLGSFNRWTKIHSSARCRKFLSTWKQKPNVFHLVKSGWSALKFLHHILTEVKACIYRVHRIDCYRICGIAYECFQLESNKLIDNGKSSVSFALLYSFRWRDRLNLHIHPLWTTHLAIEHKCRFTWHEINTIIGVSPTNLFPVVFLMCHLSGILHLCYNETPWILTLIQRSYDCKWLFEYCVLNYCTLKKDGLISNSSWLKIAQIVNHSLFNNDNSVTKKYLKKNLLKIAKMHLAKMGKCLLQNRTWLYPMYLWSENLRVTFSTISEKIPGSSRLLTYFFGIREFKSRKRAHFIFENIHKTMSLICGALWRV